VPAQHADCGEENGGVKQLLAHPLGRLGDRRGKHGNGTGPQHTGGDTARHPQPAPQRATARRHDDADDKRGFENFAEDDDGGGEHGAVVYFAIKWPRVVS
jgi:hypothetical protein